MVLPEDPFTMEVQLCDDDGWVRSGPMHHGTDYVCTSHAHYSGEHIRCISQAHAECNQTLSEFMFPWISYA